MSFPPVCSSKQASEFPQWAGLRGTLLNASTFLSRRTMVQHKPILVLSVTILCDFTGASLPYRSKWSQLTSVIHYLSHGFFSDCANYTISGRWGTRTQQSRALSMSYVDSSWAPNGSDCSEEKPVWYTHKRQWVCHEKRCSGVSPEQTSQQLHKEIKEVRRKCCHNNPRKEKLVSFKPTKYTRGHCTTNHKLWSHKREVPPFSRSLGIDYVHGK